MTNTRVRIKNSRMFKHFKEQLTTQLACRVKDEIFTHSQYQQSDSKSERSTTKTEKWPAEPDSEVTYIMMRKSQWFGLYSRV
jgi:hypothetical protein